jgi:hypothetical protein
MHKLIPIISEDFPAPYSETPLTGHNAAIISPRGKIYYCQDRTHKNAAQAICDSLSIDTINPELTLENQGYLKIGNTTILTIKKITKRQKDSIFDFMVGTNITRIKLEKNPGRYEHLDFKGLRTL